MATQKMQKLSEIELVTMCHKICSIEKVLSTTKEFSLKFNNHIKLITHLINCLDENIEDNLILFEEKISEQVDHMHKRLIYTTTKEGQENIFFDDENKSQINGRSKSVKNYKSKLKTEAYTKTKKEAEN